MAPSWVPHIGDTLLPMLENVQIKLDVRTRTCLEAWLVYTVENSPLSDDPASLRDALSSIVCKSARETYLFNAQFLAWQKTVSNVKVGSEPRKVPSGDGLPEGKKKGQTQPVNVVDWNSLVKILLGLLIVLCVSFEAYQLISRHSISRPSPPGPITEAVKESKEKPPAPFARVTSPNPDYVPSTSSGTSEAAQAAAAICAPRGSNRNPCLFGVSPAAYLAIVLVFAFLAWSARQQVRTQIARIRTNDALKSQDVYVEQLVAESAVRRRLVRDAARVMRRQTVSDCRELDIPASIRASVDKAGFFVPKIRNVMKTPEYVVLVDRVQSSDQQAHWAIKMVRELAAEGLSVSIYEFDRDPRWLKQVRSDREPDAPVSIRVVNLSELGTRHAGQGLIVFTAGEGLLNPLSEELHEWVQHAFRPWPRRVLMTSRSLGSWGRTERILANPGAKGDDTSFLVLPALVTSLHAVVKWLTRSEVPEIISVIGAPAIEPVAVQIETARWLSDVPPPKSELVGLIRGLKAYLGPTAFGWLAASAVYPQMSAELTAYLASKLSHEEAILEPSGTLSAENLYLRDARLVAIAVLPWCRHGFMPDWMRRALILSVPTDTRNRIKQTLFALFSTAGSANASAALLLGSVWTQASAETVWTRGLMAKVFAKVMPGEEYDSPLRDRIYVGVLRGDFDVELSLDAPGAFERAAGANTGVILTHNPVRWIAAAVVASFFLMVWIGALKTESSDLRRVRSDSKSRQKWVQDMDKNMPPTIGEVINPILYPLVGDEESRALRITRNAFIGSLALLLIAGMLSPYVT